MEMAIVGGGTVGLGLANCARCRTRINGIAGCSIEDFGSAAAPAGT